MVDKCIFCGRRELSKEHIFSRWVNKVLQQDERGLDPEGKHFQSVVQRGQVMEERTWKGGAGEISFFGRCVCTRCNNEWMSQFDQTAIPALTEMILGRPIQLNTEVRLIIARWLALKSIIDRCGMKKPTLVRQEWRTYLYQRREPPLSWQIRIGRYIGKIPGTFVSETTDAFPKAKSFWQTTMRQRRHLSTIVIGQFIAQVFATDLRVDLTLPTYYIDIWPQPIGGSVDDLLDWPPKLVLTDALAGLIPEPTQPEH